MELERIISQTFSSQNLPDINKEFWSANKQLVNMLNFVVDKTSHIYDGDYKKNVHDIKLALELAVKYANKKGINNIFVSNDKCKIVNQRGFLQWVEYLVEGRVNTIEAKELYHELKESADSLRDYNSADLLRTLASNVYKARYVLPKSKHKL